jgi:dipeptidyl aminopeptidase/acylaminoacyl peptidase
MERWYRAGWTAACLAVALWASGPLRAEVVEQGSLLLDGLPTATAADEADGARLAEWLEFRQAGFVDWLADGSLLVTTRFGETDQLHRVQQPLGQRQQLTFGREPVRNGRARPGHPEQLLYLQDKGGDENQQLWLLSLADGQRRLLSDGKSLHGSPAWSNDGRWLAFHSNARDGLNYDVYVQDVDAGTPPRLVAGGGHQAFYVQDWNYDDSRLLVLSYTANTESQLLVVDVASGALRQLEPAAGSGLRLQVSAARFSRDGRGLYFVSTGGGDLARLYYQDLFTGERRAVSAEGPHEVESLEVARDGRHLAYTRNEGGYSRLVVHDILADADRVLPALPQGAVVASLGFDASGRQLAVALESARQPRDVLVLDLATPGVPSWTAWTRSEPGPAGLARHVAAEAFSYPTWDRVDGQPRQIPAFIQRPASAGPHPVLIQIHGGPESQHRPGWDNFAQFLVNELGFAVVAPNVRGSSGYGRQYLALDNGRLREDSVRDIGALLAWIAAQPDLDRRRVVVMGGSYGGYMTLASLVHYGDRLAGGIDVVGISHFVTFLERTSPYRQEMRRSEYGDERDPAMRAFLQRISPLTRAESIRLPLLVVQGLNDPRVPASESEQMVAKIRGGGGEVWYLAARDEGHGFRKKGNRDTYLRTAVAFLRRVAAPR